MKRVRGGRVTMVLVALMAALGASQPAVAADAPYRLDAFRWKDTKVRVASVIAGSGAVVKRIMAYPSLSGRRTTSAIGIRSGSLVATNGDFNIYGTNTPRRQSVIDGEIMSTGTLHQPGFVLRTTADGARAVVDRPVFKARVTQGATTFALAGWNAQQPSHGAVVGFTARGGDERHPSARNCSALLAPVDVQGADRRYEVVEIRDDCTRRPLQPPRGSYSWVVLHGREVRALQEGSVRMRVNLGLQREARQVMGGSHRLVQAGRNVVSPHGEGGLFDKHPRTALGITRGCTDQDRTSRCRYIVVTADGRRPGWSKGLRLRTLGRLMVRLDAYAAVNLDGGGSTTMWTRRRTSACQISRAIGCLVNRPSGTERRVIDGVGVIPVG